MKKLAWLLALSLPLAACVVGEDGTGDGDGNGNGNGSGNGSGSGSGSGSNSANTISEDTTWSGTFDVTAELTIAAGVTVTVDPGTAIKFAPGTSVTVSGTLTAAGTKASPITIGAATAGGQHGGFKIPTGGVLNLTYVTQTGGPIQTSGGKAVIVDTAMSGAAGGDFLIMSGGELDMTYSQIGLPTGQDSTHCNMHFGGPMANTIKVTNSNISATPYGLMFYGGTNANFTNNNWFGNQIDVATQPGVSGDFTGSWFDETPPAALGNGGAQLNVTTLAAARLVDAGPR
jgi:hypothetical protein